MSVGPGKNLYVFYRFLLLANFRNNSEHRRGICFRNERVVAAVERGKKMAGHNGWPRFQIIAVHTPETPDRIAPNKTVYTFADRILHTRYERHNIILNAIRFAHKHKY